MSKALRQLPRSLSSPSSIRDDPLSAEPSTELSEVYSPDLDRDRLPLGVSRLMASRMRHDASLNPAMLSLRMNNQNLKNELILHKGNIISHQFALMRPRRKPTLKKPKDLELPNHCSVQMVQRMSKLIEKQQAADFSKELVKMQDMANSQQELVGNVATSTSQSSTAEIKHKKADKCSNCGNVLLPDSNFCRKCGKPRPEASEVEQEEPEAERQIENLLREGRVEAVIKPFEITMEGVGTGLPHDRVGRCLHLLGFTDLDDQKVQACVKEVNTGAPLSVEDFAKVVVNFERARQRDLYAKFQELDEDKSGTVSSRELRHLLWDLGYTVSNETVDDIVKEIDKNNSGSIDFQEFASAVRIISERSGFTKDESEKLFSLFDKYDTDGSGEISAEELASLLGYFGTPTSIKQANKIISSFDSDGDGTLGRNEFLSVMRIRLEDEISDLRTLFAEFDIDQSGTIDASEVLPLIHSLNYSVFPDVIEESIADVLGSKPDGLVFEDVLKVVQRIREQEGFSKAEVAELKAVFKQHDVHGNDDMREFELARALNWLGYPLSHQRRRLYWCKVDVDKTDSIGTSEFLKFIRLLREDETVAAKALVANASSGGADGGKLLRESGLRDMLNKLGYAPPPALINQALSKSADSSGDGSIDLVGILDVLRFIREGQVLRLRQSAGLPDNLAAKVRGKFALRLETGKKIEPADVERFMYDIFKTARQMPEERQKIKDLIAQNSKEGTLDLMAIFWVVKHYGDHRDEAAWKREQEAASSAGFAPSQVAQFRSKFVQADNDGSGYLSQREIQAVFDDVIKLNIEQVRALQKELSAMSITADGSDWVDFPEFLRLMRVVSVKDIEAS